MIKDSLGDRMKQYESQVTTLKLNPNKPIVCRLDGNNFSKFTKGLNKPFDIRFSNLMYEITEFATKEVGADIGYCQSDEITLIWKQGINSQMYHNGKIFKILSKLASKVSVKFNMLLFKYNLEDKEYLEPIFDCRVFNVPTNIEAFNSLLWRVIDCRKNSVSSLYFYTFGHKQGLNKNTYDKINELIDVDDWNNYDNKFKYGRFVKKFAVKQKLTKQELQELPQKHNARKNPNLEFERTIYKEINIDQPLQNCTNKEEFIFKSVYPKFN